jgi:hypothetical protein
MQVQQQLSLLGDSGRTIQVPTAIHKALSAGLCTGDFGQWWQGQ